MGKKSRGALVEYNKYLDEETHWKRKGLLSVMGGKDMLEIITGEASKGYKKKKSDKKKLKLINIH